MLFKLDPLIMIITSISERALIAGTLVSLLMLVLAFFGGRFFCGWICPLGSCIDAAGTLNRNSGRENDAVNNKLHPIKIFALGAILALALFGRQEAWLMDPIVITARFVSLNLIPFVTSSIALVFTVLIKTIGGQGAITDIYHSMRSSFLGVKITYFPHSYMILALFAAILTAALFMRRAWCRALCPLGALYSLVSGLSLLRRRVKTCTHCKKCKSLCRMGAIKDDNSYNKGECILCMDCVYNCPIHSTSFSFMGSGEVPALTKKDALNKTTTGISRKTFILLLTSPLLLIGNKFVRSEAYAGQGRAEIKPDENTIIRPPAAIKEIDFLNRCVRCGNCMKVCPTNGLQPLAAKDGYAAMWTPALIPETGYCEYKCTLCGNTCPTGAIKRVAPSEKLTVKLGTAEVDHGLCIAWAENKECIVCEEHCPIFEKAIKLREDIVDGKKVLKPYIDEYLCVGCGICQNKCPTRPVRAIRVTPKGASRP